MEQPRGTLPMGVDKVNTCHENPAHTDVLRYALQPQRPLAPTEHVLRADGQGLASSSSYHSLLALLLLPCSQLITTDKGHTGLCRHHWIERVVLSGAGLQVRRALTAE